MKAIPQLPVWKAQVCSSCIPADSPGALSASLAAPPTLQESCRSSPPAPPAEPWPPPDLHLHLFHKTNSNDLLLHTSGLLCQTVALCMKTLSPEFSHSLQSTAVLHITR